MEIDRQNAALRRVRTAVLIITAVYLLVRIYPLAKARPDLSWETAQAKQLQKYGIVERRGAELPWGEFSYGTLSHPERFNYCHHPYPAVWLVVATELLFGPFGGLGLVLVYGLALCLATYFALRIFYQPIPALFVACLVAVIPGLISMTMDTDPYGLGGLLWPVGVLLIGRSRRETEPPPVLVFLLGLTVFLAGQIFDWFTWIVVPGLLVMSAVPRPTMWEALRDNMRNALWKAILTGAFLSTALFVLQVVYYDPSIRDEVHYARFLSSSSGHAFFASSHVRMLLAALLRSIVLTGMALPLGFAMGIWLAMRQRRSSPILAGSITGLACFAGVGILWPFFFVRETWVHLYNLFPLACLSAWALEQLKRPVAFWLFGFLASFGVINAQLTASLPMESRGSRKLAEFLTQQTAPTDLVLSNFRPYTFPFAIWDDAAHMRAARRADRLFFWGIDSMAAWQSVTRRFDGDLPRICFIKLVGAPMDPDLDETLKTRGRKILTSQLVFPIEDEGLAVRLRSFYWKLQGRGNQLARENRAGQQERTATIELYDLR